MSTQRKASHAHIRQKAYYGLTARELSLRNRERLRMDSAERQAWPITKQRASTLSDRSPPGFNVTLPSPMGWLPPNTLSSVAELNLRCRLGIPR